MERFLDQILSLFSNRGLKRLLGFFFLYLFLMLAFFFCLNIVETNELKTERMTVYFGMLGVAAKNDPSLAAELGVKLGQSFSEEDVRRGQGLAKAYGLTEKIPSEFVPYLERKNSPFFWGKVSFFLLLTLLLLMMILREYIHSNKKVKSMANRAEAAATGELFERVEVIDDGEWGRLEFQMNEMGTRLQELVELLKQEKVQLKDTIADISHQLKTPLASLSIFQECLEQELTAEERSDFLKRSRMELDRMDWFIQHLLMLVRLEADAVAFQYQSFSVHKTVKQACEQVTALFQAKDVDLQIKTDEQPDALLQDKTWLTEAFSNILKNALEHTDSGKNVFVSIESTLVTIKVRIRDQGAGIPAKHIPHIFKKFHTAHTTSKTSAGLGLALAKSIIEKHFGAITVDSEENVGTTFEITFLKNAGQWL